MKHCNKCNGSGFLLEYSGIKNGVCFACGGKKTRSSEEIKKINKAKKIEKIESAKHRKELYELPYFIEKKEEFIKELFNAVLEDPPETKEEKQAITKIALNQQQKLKQMKNRLTELKEAAAN